MIKTLFSLPGQRVFLNRKASHPVATDRTESRIVQDLISRKFGGVCRKVRFRCVSILCGRTCSVQATEIAGWIVDEKLRERRMEQIRMAFANNVRALRTERGWTQQELADKLGVHRITVTRIESGQHQPLFGEACIMADILGASIASMRDDLSKA